MSASPFALLKSIEADCRRRAAGLPQREEKADFWVGVGFRVGDVYAVAPLDEVEEMSPIPAMTRVPGGQDWVLGLANVRGNLVPVFDLPGFLAGENLIPDKQTRLLIFRQQGIHAGILVNQSIGLRHFDLATRVSHVQAEEMLTPFVSAGFTHEGRVWPVFSLQALAQDERFLHVSR